MGTEHLDIAPCPKCDCPSHRYSLEVQRSYVVKYALGGFAEPVEQPRRVRFTRLFTCPTKNEEFQATFSLRDSSYNRISSVEVTGIDNARQ